MISTNRSRVLLGLLVFVLMLGASSAFAQSNGNGIGVGIKGGLLFSNLDFGADDDFLKNKTGFTGGLFIGGNRGGLLGVEADIFYSSKGANVDGSGSDFDIRMLEIPVLLRLNVGSGSLSSARVYGLAGPSMGFRLKSEFGGIDIVDFTEGYDVNVVLGAGVELTRFLVEARYNHGVKNISKNFSESADIKTRSYAVLLGIRFN